MINSIEAVYMPLFALLSNFFLCVQLKASLECLEMLGYFHCFRACATTITDLDAVDVVVVVISGGGVFM